MAWAFRIWLWAPSGWFRDAALSGERHPYTERELELLLTGDEVITVDCTVSALLERDAAVELLVELRQVDRQLRINRRKACSPSRIRHGLGAQPGA